MEFSRIMFGRRVTTLSLEEFCIGINLGTETQGGKKDDQFRQPQKAVGPLLGVRGSYMFAHGIRYLQDQWVGA